MIEQELWGVLLGYNIIRYQMVNMAKTIPGIIQIAEFYKRNRDNPTKYMGLAEQGTIQKRINHLLDETDTMSCKKKTEYTDVANPRAIIPNEKAILN